MEALVVTYNYWIMKSNQVSHAHNQNITKIRLIETKSFQFHSWKWQNLQSNINRNWTAPWSTLNLVMPLIYNYVHNGYPKKKNKFWRRVGVTGYPCTMYMHVPIWEQSSIPKSSEKRENFIISLALFDLSQSVSSNCPSKWMWTHGRKSRVGVERRCGEGYLPKQLFKQGKIVEKTLY